MKRLHKLGWYVRRAAVMPPAEIPWRIGRTLGGWRDALRAGPQRGLAPVAPSSTGCLVPGDPQAREALVAMVEDWMNRGVPLFNARWPLLGPMNWMCCPRTGTIAPRTYGMHIDYRDEELVGDIKYLWEPARFQFAVPIAQAWRVTRDQRYLVVLRDQLDSFLDQNPYPIGVHWSSALENAIRLINWALVWELVGGHDGPLFLGAEGERLRRDWLDSIYWHQHFVDRHYAAYSSANNHLIGEAGGVFIASGVWPCWANSDAWRARAAGVLERECLAQNHPDGVNAEQAIWYQQFVLDFLLLAWLQADRLGNRFSAAFRERVESMLAFLAAMTDSGGNLPQLGDADDGLATGLWGGGVRGNFASLLATGAILFQRPALARVAPALDDKTRALLGDRASERWAMLRAQTGDTLPRRFPNGGYFLLGAHWGTKSEVRCLLDGGPLGMGALAAHGHADALALCLSVGGHPVLVDPGTYAYHTGRRWRDYFRGTSAHNTLRLGGIDQSEIGGSFMWIRKAATHADTGERASGVQWFQGAHDGYQRRLGATHRRAVEYDPRALRFFIRDDLEISRSTAVEQFWHCHPECEARLTGTTISIAVEAVRVTLSLDPKLDWKLVRGDESSPAGWYSSRFDSREEATTVVGRGVAGSAVSYETIIKVEHDV